MILSFGSNISIAYIMRTGIASWLVIGCVCILGSACVTPHTSASQIGSKSLKTKEPTRPPTCVCGQSGCSPCRADRPKIRHPKPVQPRPRYPRRSAGPAPCLDCRDDHFSKQGTYRVVEGDTLTSISRYFGVSIDSIRL